VNYGDLLETLKCRGNEVQGIHLGLQRMRAIVDALGNPQRRFAAVHIAGTNGKGSVAAMVESILRRSGVKTALYTSPHLVRLEERIRVSGRDISRPDLAHAGSQISGAERVLLRDGRIDRPLTYFEFITGCAFIHFARRGVEVAVIEVGLGGTLDATNVLDPELCVITGVAYDHQNLLGNTLAEIAREKAGIIKPGVTVISGCASAIARRVVRHKARTEAAPLLEIDVDYAFQAKSMRGGRFTFDLTTPLRIFKGLRLSLAGEHQIRNAALAVAAVENLTRFPVTVKDVRHGLASVEWPGRLDEFRARRRTLLDGAHNPDGARMLSQHIRQIRLDRVCLVFAAMRDKDIRKMAKLLFPLAESIHLAPLNNPRSAVPEAIEAMFPSFRARISRHSSAAKALQAAWQECPATGLVVVTGSLYLVGEVLPMVRRRQSCRSKLA
jgi:dihydrofolate synthase / folylpolyglutamate synthase